MPASAILIALALLLPTQALASRIENKPLVYVDRLAEDDLTDVLVARAYGPRFRIVQTQNQSLSLSKARPRFDRVVPPPKTSSGEPLDGTVVVAYVVTMDGRARDLTILDRSDDRLVPVVRGASAGWRFESARLDGLPVASLACHEVRFAVRTSVFDQDLASAHYDHLDPWQDRNQMPWIEPDPPRRGRLSSIRLPPGPPGFSPDIRLARTRSHILRVVSLAEEGLSRSSGHGDVIIDFSIAPGRQGVRLRAKGQLEKDLLAKLRKDLSGLPKLDVARGTLALQLEIRVYPRLP